MAGSVPVPLSVHILDPVVPDPVLDSAVGFAIVPENGTTADSCSHNGRGCCICGTSPTRGAAVSMVSAILPCSGSLPRAAAGCQIAAPSLIDVAIGNALAPLAAALIDPSARVCLAAEAPPCRRAP